MMFIRSASCVLDLIRDFPAAAHQTLHFLDSVELVILQFVLFWKVEMYLCTEKQK